MQLNITVPKGEIDKLRKELKNAPKGLAKAMSGAINKTAGGVMTDTTRAVTKEYTAKSRDVRSVLRLSRKATPASLSAAITGTYKALSLTAFKLRPNKAVKHPPSGGLTVTVRRGQSYRIKTGFIANLGGKARAVMRKGKARFPVKILYGPTVAKMMAEDDIASTVMGQASKRLAVNLDRQAQRILKT